MPKTAGLAVPPTKEHLVPKHQELVPLTSVPLRRLSSLVSSDSPEQCQVEELELPSTPDTFEAARDLIAMMAPQPLAVRDEPPVPHHPALSRGKPAILRRSPSPVWHHSPRCRSRSWLPRHCYLALGSRLGSPAPVRRCSPSLAP